MGSTLSNATARAPEGTAGSADGHSDAKKEANRLIALLEEKQGRQFEREARDSMARHLSSYNRRFFNQLVLALQAYHAQAAQARMEQCLRAARMLPGGQLIEFFFTNYVTFRPTVRSYHIQEAADLATKNKMIEGIELAQARWDELFSSVQAEQAELAALNEEYPDMSLEDMSDLLAELQGKAAEVRSSCDEFEVQNLANETQNFKKMFDLIKDLDKKKMALIESMSAKAEKLDELDINLDQRLAKGIEESCREVDQELIRSILA